MVDLNFEKSCSFNIPKEIKLIDVVKTKTSRGMLSKGWYIIDGKICLVKGNSTDRENNIGYEPYSEVLAYKIGKLFGLPVIPYYLAPSSLFPDIKTYSSEYVCYSHNFLNFTEQFVSLKDYLERFNYSFNYDNCLQYFREYYLDSLLIFDALICNEDRHVRNLGFVKTIKGEYLPSPVFDNGASLLAWVSDNRLRANSCYFKRDIARPFEMSHRSQVSLVRRNNLKGKVSLKEILKELEPTFELMSPRRVSSIKQFLTYRYNYFILGGETGDL